MNNEAQIEYWNGPAGEKWVRHAEIQDRQLEGLGRAAMDALDLAPGHAVLDIGCGNGTNSFQLGERVGDEVCSGVAHAAASSWERSMP